MMADEKREQEEEVTPKGAVEVDEKDLDQAAGGAAEVPMDQVSLNYSKIVFDTSTQRVAPQDASIGLLREGEKKL
jgi:hypothetical protein